MPENVSEYLSGFYPGWVPSRNVPCFVAKERHAKGTDNRPSLSVSEDGKAYCHSCGFKAGSIVGVHREVTGKSFKDACCDLYRKYVCPLVPESYVEDAFKALMSNQFLLGRLKELRGIEKPLVMKMQLGWRGGRLTIPVRDECNMLVNVRRYDLIDGAGPKMLSWKRGFGSARLWPLTALKSEFVVLCEGEMDALVGMQNGLNAVTVTGGALTWKEDWSGQFSGKRVVVVPDNDCAGEEGARARAASIAKTAKSVAVVKLNGTGVKDLSDWFMKGKGGKDRFMKLCVSAKKPGAMSGEQQTKPVLAVEASEQERKLVERGNSVFSYLTSHGSFFCGEAGELYYVMDNGPTMRFGAQRFLSFLASLSPVINSALASGKFVLQHIANLAYRDSKETKAGHWSIYHNGKLYLAVSGDEVLKLGADGGVLVLKNANNQDKVLLETAADKARFKYDDKADIGAAIRSLWDLAAAKFAVKDEDRYFLVCWLLGSLLRECVRSKPILRFIGTTASGKSTIAKLVSVLMYGEELLNNSASTSAAVYAMAGRYPVLIFDNMEVRNITPAFEDFLLTSSTGGMNANRMSGTDSGGVLERLD